MHDEIFLKYDVIISKYDVIFSQYDEVFSNYATFKGAQSAVLGFLISSGVAINARHLHGWNN